MQLRIYYIKILLQNWTVITFRLILGIEEVEHTDNFTYLIDSNELLNDEFKPSMTHVIHSSAN